MKKMLLTFLAMVMSFVALAADDLPQTPMPEFVVETTDTQVIVSAVGYGDVCLYLDGVVVENPYVFYRSEVEQVYVMQATAQELGHPISEMASYEVVVPSLPQTPMPEFVVETTDTQVIVTAVGYGDVCLYLDGELVENPYVFYCSEVEQVYVMQATAQEQGHPISEMASYEVVVPTLPQTPMPEFVVETTDAQVIVSAVGYGEVHLYVDDEEVSNPYVVDRGEVERVIEMQATAQEQGHPISEMAFCLVEVPAVEVPVLPPTPDPEIVVETTDTQVIVSAVGDGDVHLFLNGEEVSNPYFIDRTNEDFLVNFEAYATMPGYLNSSYVSMVVYVPQLTLKSDPPGVSIDSIPNCSMVTLYSMESMTDIDFRYCMSTDDGMQWTDWTDWEHYLGTLLFDRLGLYHLQARCTSPGKLKSDVMSVMFSVLPPSNFYDFVEDGIYYKIIGPGKVGVTPNYGDGHYRGDIAIPAKVTHDGTTFMVTAINEGAFKDCEDMASVSIGAYVTTIGNHAFSSCSGLTSVTIGDYVISIGEEAFYGCYNLSTVTLGSGLRTIGSRAFYSCSALRTVNCRAATPPVMPDGNAFHNYLAITLRVFPAVLDSYQRADYWKDFMGIVGDDGVAPTPGDLDGNGAVDIVDVTALIGHVLGNH